jgi:hypothetical protein
LKSKQTRSVTGSDFSSIELHQKPASKSRETIILKAIGVETNFWIYLLEPGYIMTANRVMLIQNKGENWEDNRKLSTESAANIILAYLLITIRNCGYHCCGAGSK